MIKRTSDLRHLNLARISDYSFIWMPKRAVLGLLALMLWFVSSNVFAIAINVSPPNQIVNIGDPVSIDVDISGLGDGAAPSVGAFDIDVDFDPVLLNLAAVVFGTELDDLLDPSFQDVVVGAGEVNVAELSFSLDLDTLQPSAFTLFTLTFDTLAVGTSVLDLTRIELGDASGASLSADVTVNNGSITIVDPTGVPVPATLALLGLGVCLVACRRRPSLSCA